MEEQRCSASPPPSPELRSQRGLRGAEGLSGVPIRSVGAGRGGGWRGWGPPALRDPPGRRERRSVVLAVVVVEEGGVPVGQGAVLRRLLFLLRVVRLLPVAPLILHHLRGGGRGQRSPGCCFLPGLTFPPSPPLRFSFCPIPPPPPPGSLQHFGLPLQPNIQLRAPICSPHLTPRAVPHPPPSP